MVDVKESYKPEDEGFPTYTITDPEKSGAEYYVHRTKGEAYLLFSISISKGNLPADLEGNFTKAKDAIELVKKYLKNKREPSTGYKARKRYDEKEENAKASESI